MNEPDAIVRILIGFILVICMGLWLVFLVRILPFFIQILRALMHPQKHRLLTTEEADHIAKGSNYSHPCQGQCQDPSVILKKSPTPKYHHNCHAPCAFATRSGRYYKGKRKK